MCTFRDRLASTTIQRGRISRKKMLTDHNQPETPVSHLAHLKLNFFAFSEFSSNSKKHNLRNKPKLAGEQCHFCLGNKRWKD
uniref:Uncharacterized protein n=1 Tax=Romanomermis culicivorax TaxID=13658 RepID=A0A915IIN6_ROMCU